ncbi:hypothetical protein [Nonomuraea rosea]
MSRVLPMVDGVRLEPDMQRIEVPPVDPAGAVGEMTGVPAP